MPDDSQGRIRYAAHHLLAEWGAYDHRCADTMAEIRREAATLTPILDSVPGAGELTAKICDIMRAGTTQAENELRQAGERYAAEARTLLGLLTREPDLATHPFTLPDPGSGLTGSPTPEATRCKLTAPTSPTTPSKRESRGAKIPWGGRTTPTGGR